jgi:hypothetical protein
MARLRGRAPSGISLFPFLSVLASVIGTMTLIIACTAIGQIHEAQAPGEKIAPRAEREQESQRLRKELDEVRGKLNAAEQQAQSAEKADQRRARLEKELQQALPGAKLDVPTLRAEEQRLDEDAAGLADDLKSVQSASAVAEQRLKSAAPGSDKDSAVRIHPGGSGKAVKPTFVEVTAGELVIHNKGQTERVPRAEIESSAALRKVIEANPKVENTNRVLIFLIRPEGVPTYRLAAQRAEKANFSKLPVPGSGPLDLSMFDMP